MNPAFFKLLYQGQCVTEMGRVLYTRHYWLEWTRGKFSISSQPIQLWVGCLKTEAVKILTMVKGLWTCNNQTLIQYHMHNVPEVLWRHSSVLHGINSTAAWDLNTPHVLSAGMLPCLIVLTETLQFRFKITVCHEFAVFYCTHKIFCSNRNIMENKDLRYFPTIISQHAHFWIVLYESVWL